MVSMKVYQLIMQNTLTQKYLYQARFIQNNMFIMLINTNALEFLANTIYLKIQE